jgi:hypothetical protein
MAQTVTAGSCPTTWGRDKYDKQSGNTATGPGNGTVTTPKRRRSFDYLPNDFGSIKEGKDHGEEMHGRYAGLGYTKNPA